MYKSKKYTEEQFIVAVANYSAVGRQLGVSDNAVRKRLRRYDVTVA